jgi:hypothetical protein
MDLKEKKKEYNKRYRIKQKLLKENQDNKDEIKDNIQENKENKKNIIKEKLINHINNNNNVDENKINDIVDKKLSLFFRKEKQPLSKKLLENGAMFILPILLKTGYSLISKLTEKKSTKLPHTPENIEPIQNILLF